MRRPSAARALARSVLSLPPPVLRLMSGGGVVYRAGRTLDPRLQFLAAQARRQPRLETLSPEDARRVEAQAAAAMGGSPAPGVRWEAASVDTPSGLLGVRLYRPDRQDPDVPAMVWAHMGGGVIGSLETSHAFCTLLARTCRGPVVSVDYRLAPEHRFPAGLEDMLAAYRWARAEAGALGAPAGRAAVGGDSMGACFAAAACQELRRLGEPQPALQLLVYPCTDVSSQTPSMSIFADAFPLTRPMMEWFLGHYIGPGDDPADPRLSPLRGKDLAGLAPAVIATAGFDPLQDQGEAYARRLKDAGVQVAYRRYDSLSHAFLAFTGVVPAAEGAAREIADLAAGAFEEAGA